MSTPMEEAIEGLKEARISLKRAEDRLNAYMDNPANKPLNTNDPTYW
jgi:hypothetical protein